ncbi:MAG: tRNA (adenosine(37)-N6)-threonylcarbamoyltransferase complex dimerization subunit type 1 TsaB [Synergistaceae bacterium]|jgi:tRNA threonylcarbamoyladenosine biosynthesis protein TsaB|nr:tRNA (adenosine(37)-N6)-threonylcarbamoyltransferase complex dimerization subunit type 1 TsaB [Synergistaceae bacterium]
MKTETEGNFLLALDCGLRWTNAAALSDGIEISERLDIGRRQAEEMPLAVGRVLAAAGRRFEDIGLVAVTNGPGYFTGLRVGVSYAAALAYGLGIDVVPVSTLHMLAFPHIERARPVLVLVYAGRGCVYSASFGCGDALPAAERGSEELESWFSRQEEFPDIVSDDPAKAAETLDWRRPILPSPPDALTVARIARRARQTAVSPMTLRVAYLRDPQVG